MAAKSKGMKALAKVSDYQTVFGNPQGQKVLHDLMSIHGILNSTFDKDPYEMARKEGERNVVLRILSVLNVDIIAMHRKIKEAADEAIQGDE